jgi:hypothetical protein
VNGMTHQQHVLAGATLIAAGSWLLYRTYDASGRRRPFVLKLLPGA